MSAPPPDLAAYHIGIVVHDLDSALDRYRRMLGIDLWRVRELQRARPPWQERFSDVQLKLAFGRGAGLTFELIQVLEGTNQHTQFLEAHGEGVQHIGFWTPDLRASVEAALAQGAQLVNGLIDADGNASVQLTASSRNEEIIRALDPRGITYVDPNVATVQFEFVGSTAGMRGWMEQDFDRIIVPPPWEA
jgi:catechol 2,3-dioxygenase-like lactoylglutathione lyase family enzyme